MTDKDTAHGEPAVPSPLLLGIDAGGTMVRALVADANGRIVGSGQSTGANPRARPAGRPRGPSAADRRVDQRGGDGPGRGGG